MCKKKLHIGLAPLLAIAAFAAMPAASQAACTPPACAHVYKNGVISTEGKKLRHISWGTLKLNDKTFGEVECHTLWPGYSENPTGGGATIGKVQAFAPYECASPSCIALGGKGIDVKSGQMPWSTEVIENTPGVFRLKIGNKSAEQTKFTVNCEGVVTPSYFGEIDALILNNGISIGAAPGELKFEAALESTTGPGEIEGTFKIEGYGLEELIEVKNP